MWGVDVAGVACYLACFAGLLESLFIFVCFWAFGNALILGEKFA